MLMSNEIIRQLLFLPAPGASLVPARAQQKNWPQIMKKPTFDEERRISGWKNGEPKSN